MTNRQRYYKYEVKVDGIAWKWFKNLDNAVDEYNFLAECGGEFEKSVQLVDIKTGEMLMEHVVA